MVIDEKILSELEQQLLGEKEKLEGSLARIAKPVNKKDGDYETSFDELGDDREDNATEVDVYSGNVSVETSLETQLQDVIDALERIKAGTYGKCSNCGKEISVERLRANPAAKTCINC